MSTPMSTVLIVGSGPTGLTLACDLARRGIGVRIIEKSPHFPRSSRAKGPNPRSLEVFADLGVADRIIAAGGAIRVMRKYRDGQVITDTDPHQGTAPTPGAPYDRGTLIPQWRLEEILRHRLAEYGVRVELDAELVEFTQDDAGVTARLADGRCVEASYLVGCDGGHSTVRKALGVRFDGTTDETQVMVCGDVDLDGLDRDIWHQWFDADGAVMLCPIPGTVRSWWFQAGPERDGEGGLVAPSLAGFQRLFDRHARLPGITLGDATLLSTYRVNVRMVDRFRVGRVFLAGDAAHVHPIAGGLGMNTGIQDAFNLGWKLAMVASGQAGAGLLDTYEEERLPVAAWTLDVSSDRLRAVLEATKKPGGGLDVVGTPETSTLGLGYRWSSLSWDGDGREGRLRAGDRAPDAPCRDFAGSVVRLFEVFAGAHFTLLGFGSRSRESLHRVASEWGETVCICAVDADPAGLADPEGGGLADPEAGLADPDGHARGAYGITGDALVLIRPDNHVALTAPADGPDTILNYQAMIAAIMELQRPPAHRR